MTPEQKMEWQSVVGHMPRAYFDLLLALLDDTRREAYEDAAKMCEDQDLPIMADRLRSLATECEGLKNTEGDGK